MAIYCLTCRSKDVEEIVEGNRLFYYCSQCNKKYGRALIVDGRIKILHTSRGIKHIDAAAIIIWKNKMLFLERRGYPFGLMIPAGHLEYNETLEEALHREVYEEVGLKVKNATLLAQIEQPISYCRYGSDIEEWAVFLVEAENGEPVIANNESESMQWIPLNKIPVRQLTPHTRYALATLGYIKDKVPKKSEKTS